MLKLKYDNNFFKNSMLVFFLLLILIIIYKVIDNISPLFSNILYITSFTFNLLKPFIYALIISYFLNPFVKFLEEHLFKRKNIYIASERKRRGLSILILYLSVILLFSLIIDYIIPVIKLNIKDLFKIMPDFLNNTEKFIENLPSKLISPESIRIKEKLSEAVVKYTEKINADSINIYFGMLMEKVLKLTMGFFKVLLGFIIAVYILMDKEKISKGLYRIIRAVFNENTSNRIRNIFKNANTIFSRFIIGKFIDSFIVTVLCLLIMLVFKIKYSLLISIIVGISNMIPYFGPIVGAVPPIIITLLYSPGKAIMVAFLLFILQQFDGNYLEPKILGDSLGLSPLWIIFAIFIGGGFFGFFGMLIGVPAAAVIKSLLDGWIDKKLKNK